MAADQFTLDELDGLLETALGAGYRFAGFDELRGGGLADSPAILLRHDIDYEPAQIGPVAELEAERGIAATYFIQLDSHFYDGEGPAASTAIEHLLANGHQLGLHLDATAISSDAEVVRRAGELVERLERRWGVRVCAVSFHMPGVRPVGHLDLGNRVNTYAPDFFERFAYASDSNQHWRETDIESLLGERRHPLLQLLIHPFWWRRDPSRMFEKLEALAADLGVPVGEILTGAQVKLMSAAERGRAEVEPSDDEGPLSSRLRQPVPGVDADGTTGGRF